MACRKPCSGNNTCSLNILLQNESGNFALPSAMSDDIKHECGLAFIGYASHFHITCNNMALFYTALNKLYLLMEKQHNRGQDGAGIASVKAECRTGLSVFCNRMRSIAPQPIADIFWQMAEEITDLEKYQPDIKKHPGLLKGPCAFPG